MTLAEHIAARIAAQGPLSIAEYMSECLLHPTLGYYTTREPFGATGDFVTAPEISQMFGELIGLCLAQAWLDQGAVSGIALAELGPGRGTLMADMLRAAAKVPGFKDAASVHFVEASTQLRALQAEKVPDAQWHDDFGGIPEGPTLVVANEFFDALPIHQYEKQGGKWLERSVGLVGDRLGFVLTQPAAQFALAPPHLLDAPDGSLLEVCPGAISMSATVATHLAAHGGAALYIDYGYATSAPGDTFQALKAHEFADPFAEPGKADLTAHVAFDRIAQAAEATGAKPTVTTEQGTFLMTIGLGVRAQKLAETASKNGQERILSELKRLTAPDEMGALFKVLAVQHPTMPRAPGF